MFLFVCIIAMIITGFLSASSSIKYNRELEAYKELRKATGYRGQFNCKTITDSNFFTFLVIIDLFFGIGASVADKIEFWIVLIVAVISFIVGYVTRCIVGGN